MREGWKAERGGGGGDKGRRGREKTKREVPSHHVAIILFV
jgi:hypothetical protein